MLGGEVVVSRTLDVSVQGMSLDTAAWFPIGTRLSISLVDPGSGTAMELIGDVVREATKKRWALGILLIEPPAEWGALVAKRARESGPMEKPAARRRRVLVVGDEQRQRGAMALYVTSGWDVVFASDVASVHEALGQIKLDAIVAELDGHDPRLPDIMRDAKRIQPGARRIVRGSGRSEGDMVHRFVDPDEGLEPLLDAVDAEIPRRAGSEPVE